MKTGYTDAAGYCLVTSAVRDGMRLIAVVLGAPSAASAQRRRAEAARVRLHELRDAQAVCGRPRDRQRARLGRRARVRGLRADRGHLRDDPARRVREARGQHGRRGAARGAARARHARSARSRFRSTARRSSRARSSCSPTSWTAACGRACATSCSCSGNERRRRVAAEVSHATWPIKVFGRNDPGFRDCRARDRRGALRQGLHASPSSESKQAAYLSLTITVRAESRAQVDALYQALVANELILMVL